jgi:hypothetical protein
MSTLCEVFSAVFAEGSAELYDSRLFELPGNYEDPLDPEDVRKARWHPLHTSRKVHEQGVAHGCELCSSITSILPANSSDLRIYFLFQSNYVWPRLCIIGSTMPHQTPPRGNILEFSITPISDSSHITDVHESAMAAGRSLHTESSEALHLASLWLKECTTRHDSCARLSKPTWYPTRLLEVVDDTVRLVVTAEQDLHGPYLTLSHRWGFVPPKLMLTPESVSFLKNGLDIAALEPTFRDALVVTRSLGFQNMWIYLFCILQGQEVESQRDWARESVTMDRVCAGSLLNISAACSHGGTAGCFRPTSALHEDHSIVCLWAKHRGDEPSYHELVRSIPLSRFHDELTEFYRSSPIFSRGWIVQERILAPRVLHFADRGMIWVCSEGVGTQPQPHINDRPTATSRSPLPGALASSGTPRSDLIHLWNDALGTYSRSTLTMPNKDRLIALQGISKRIAELLQDILFFGFLTCRMPYSLCWASEGSMTTPNSLKNYAFPSWHFARSNDGVFLRHSSYDENEIGRRFERPLSCYFNSTNLDPALSVVPKYLCCIARIVLLVAESELEQSPPALELSLGLRLDNFVKYSDEIVKIFSSNGRYDSYSRFNIIFDGGNRGSNSDKRAWTLLPVCISGRPKSRRRPCSGLVLRQTSCGDFVRQGIFIHDGTSRPSHPYVLLEALEAATPRFFMIA